MLLTDLLDALPDKTIIGAEHLGGRVARITSDSRQVGPGDIFVAYRGVSRDGHNFIPAAIERGAAAVIVEQAVPALANVAQIVVPNGRRALALLLAAQLGYPARSLVVIGVTGTDGKTTTSSIVHHILTTDGRMTGLISTVSARIGEQSFDTGFHTTTPDAPDVQRYLAQMRDAGARYAVLETTSHGLAQDRTAGADYDVAVVTNVTHEHLDLHGSDEAYVAAKGKLFSGLATSFRKPAVPKVSVLNADDRTYPLYSQFPADVRVSYSLDRSADVTARDIALGPSGTRFTAVTTTGAFPIESRLLGRFNVANTLAAIATCQALGVEADAIQRAVATFSGIVGRLDPIDQGQPFGVIVDFAHTPNALQRVLELGRALTSSRVIAVFGSAGLRDVAKRGLMGEVSGRLADLTVITAEDPRTESLDDIMQAIALGCERSGRREGEGYVRVADRGDAIAWAVEHARPGDVVLICGKGHEQSMCFGVDERPWSDHAVARAALASAGWPARQP